VIAPLVPVHTEEVGSLSVPQTSLRRPVGSGPRAEAPAPSASTTITIHALVTDHFDLVRRWLRAFGVPRDDADDAAQQVFLVAAGKLEAIRPGSERSFLFGTARGVAANHRRISRRRPHVADEAEVAALLDGTPNPEERLGDHQAHAILEHLIGRLEDDLRDVFVLFQLDEMSTAEIAAILGIPSGTVASRLRRAREAFHESVVRLRRTSARAEGGSGQ
jgi:RNA polymerase sigma-70 factor (ECF subfamily)